MVWPRRLGILSNLIENSWGLWIVAAVGILTAVLLHRRDKKSLIWPALPAIVLWVACEVFCNNIQSYALEFMGIFIGGFAIGFAAGWLIMDIVYLLKGKVKKE